MKKYCLCLINVLLFFLLSCNDSNVELKIHWQVLCDISMADFDEMPLELVFEGFDEEKIFKLTPNKTRKLKIKKGMDVTEQGWPGAFSMFIYPTDIPAEDIEDYGALEIFLYDLMPVELTDDFVELVTNEKVLAYHYTIYKNNMEYRIFSKNNRISLDIATIERIAANDNTDLSVILDMVNKYGACYYSQFVGDAFFFSSEEFPGYILNSKLSRTGLFLLATNTMKIY